MNSLHTSLRDETDGDLHITEARKERIYSLFSDFFWNLRKWIQKKTIEKNLPKGNSYQQHFSSQN